MIKVYKLEEMPVSSEEYYSEDNDILVKYIGETMASFKRGNYYRSVYDDSTEVYSWEVCTETNKVFSRNNMTYLLNELTTMLQVNHIGE